MSLATAGFESVSPLLYLIAGLALGVVLDRGVIPGLAEPLRTRGLIHAAAAVFALRGAIIVWMAVLGAYLTLHAYANVLRADVLLAADKVLLVAAILAAALVASRIVVDLIREYERRVEGFPSVTLFVNVAQVLVFIIGALIALDSLGFSIAPLLGALGVGGLAVALALKDTLSNLFAGLQLLASRQLRPGDYVRLEGGNEGTVADISWRNTTIRDLAGNLVIVPNEKLAQSIVTNYTLSNQVVVTVPVLASYGNDLGRVESLALEVARQLGACGNDATGVAFQPYVRFQKLSNENVELTVFLSADHVADQFKVRSDYIKEFLRRCVLEKITPPFPAKTAAG